MISIQTNVNSLVAQQNLSVNSAFQSKTIQQLTSGYRINQSGDDAAGLAVANKFRSSVAELTQGVANGNDAVAQLQIMDGGMSNISQILDRLKTLATQSASGAFTGNRATLNAEFQTDLSEIDRQAESIGLSVGGTFAKSLSVYLGQGTGSGSGNGGAQALANGSVVVDLSKATVDSGSLGLKGLKAIAGTVGDTGTDIGTGSSNGTTVQDIVSARAGNSQAKSGYATFNLSGPGFSDNAKISVSANLSGVSDTSTLVSAINTAISNAANGATQAAQALKNAGVVASVNSDQYGHQQLAFSSASTAFQVQAGDQMANALMGNFASAGSATGKAVTSTVTGGTADVSTAGFNPTNVSVQVSGAGLAGPVTLKLSSSDVTVGAATTDLINQVKQNKQLQDAGFSVSLNSGNKLEFSNANGDTFNVSSVGDTANALGLGTFVTTSALNGAVAYSDISAGTGFASAATGNGVATLGFSLNGGSTGGVTAATISGSVTGTGYNGGGVPNGTVGNAAGALGSLTLSVNGNAVTVDFSKDANKSGTETVQQAADFINSQIQSQAGYGSDVKLATVDTAARTIKLSGPADGAGTISASGTAAGALGLTAASGATIVAASGSVGNTVSVNLAGGNATSAKATGTAAAPANIATGTNTIKLNIDGVDITANFSQDVNAAGKAAAFTSSTLGLSGAASTIDISSIQGGKAALKGDVVGASGVDSTVALAGYAAKKAGVTGSSAVTGSAAANTTANVDLASLAATKATATGTVIGSDSTAMSALQLGKFAATKATATSGSLGSSGATLVGATSALNVPQFAAKVATTTGTTAINATGLDFRALGATQATKTGTSVAASGAADMTTALSGLGTSLTITVKDGSVNKTHSIDIHSAGSLDAVAALINNDTGAGVGLNETSEKIHATVVNGALKLTNNATNMTAGAGNSISIVANTASEAVGLSAAGQVADTVATGVAATKLTVNFDGAVQQIDISSYTDRATLLTNLSSVGATATAEGFIKLTGSSATSATGKVNVVNNAASQALGLVSGIADNNNSGADAKTLKVNIDGRGDVDVNISGATDLTGIKTAINTAINSDSAYSGLGYGNVASINSDGALEIASIATGTAASVEVTDSEVSRALKLTTTSTLTAKGADATKLLVNIDGVGEKGVSVDSGVTTLDDLVLKINNAVKSTVGATKATLVGDVTDGTDMTNLAALDGTATNLLHITMTDNAGASVTKDFDLQAVTDLAGVALAINNGTTGFGAGTAVVSGGGTILTLNNTNSAGAGNTISVTNNLASAAVGLTGGVAANTAGKWGVVATAVGSGATGAIKLTSGATGATAGTISVIDNAVSQKLGLTTSGANLNATGADSTKLKLQIDGHQEVDVDLSTLGDNTTVNLVVAKINDTLALAGAKGYDGRYDNAASATLGVIKIAGMDVGGDVKVVNNDMSKLLGLATGTPDTTNSGAAQTLKVQLDGHQEANIDLSGLGTAKLSDIAAAINTQLSADKAHGYGASYANAATANADGTISLSGANGGGSLTVKNSNLTNALGLTSNTSDVTKTGTAGQTLGISIDGKATTQISLAALSSNAQLSDIANAINAALTNDVAYGGTYANATANPDGTITIAGKAGGSTGSVKINNDAAGQKLGLTSGPAAFNTVNGKDESIADAVAFLNTTAQKALGTDIDAKIVSLDGNGSVSIASQTKGANSSVSVVGSGTTGNLAGALQLGSYVDSAAKGTARTLQSVVDDLNQAFNGNATLQQAGLTAQINTATNSLQIKSSTGTEFRLDAWGTKTGSTDSDLGFGDAGKAFTNALAPALSTSSTVSTQGASAIGTSANGTHNTASISFQGMKFGNDDQSITISANSAAGVPQTPLTITLQNDSEAQTGATIDSAISAINTKLQQSENATLRSITAVQEKGADGKGSINFISSLSSFNVSVSASAGAAAGDGLNGGVAKTFTSATNGASSSIAIDTQAGAQQAVAALGAAIAQLGTAQATIGRGQNQLTYGISLATSQITNFSAAESQIRDTNVAQQAANLSKAQTLSQASIAAMAQANSAPQAVLSLLRG